jgi:hypothetical protein
MSRRSALLSEGVEKTARLALKACSEGENRCKKTGGDYCRLQVWN